MLHLLFQKLLIQICIIAVPFHKINPYFKIFSVFFIGATRFPPVKSQFFPGFHGMGKSTRGEKVWFSAFFVEFDYVNLPKNRPIFPPKTPLWKNLWIMWKTQVYQQFSQPSPQRAPCPEQNFFSYFLTSIPVTTAVLRKRMEQKSFGVFLP